MLFFAPGMRLVPRLSLFFVGAMTIVLSVRTWIEIGRNSESFEADMKRDHRVLGHALSAGVADAWRVGGPDDARRLVDTANSISSDTRIMWVPGEGSATRLELDETEKLLLMTRDEIQHVRLGAPGELVSVFHVHGGPDGQVGLLAIHESMAERDRFARDNLVSAAYSLFAMIAASAILTLLLNRWLVGAPVRALVDKARRVGAGDFEGAPVLRGDDELAELAREMNAMSERIAGAQVKLEAETRARIDTLQQLRHADRLATVGTLAAGIAHELGTPLAVVKGHAQMIRAKEVEGDKATESAKVVEDQAARMTHIVRQLLDFARRRGPRGDDSELGAAVRRCAELLAPMVQKKSVTVEVAAADEVRVQVDPEGLQQVLTNLMVNAIQAMPKGGTLTLTVDRATAQPPADVEKSAKGPLECARVRVSDTGEGIDEKDLPHLFEPFYTTKEPGEGTGLGLAVVYGIVRDFDGWIEVESERGRGTTFTVYLPRIRESLAAIPSPDAPKEAPGP